MIKVLPSRESRRIHLKAEFFRWSIQRGKNTLKQRFEGEKRRLQNYLKELKKIKFIQEGNVQELDKFADSLVKTVVTPHEL